jgi:hypothetical protein
MCLLDEVESAIALSRPDQRVVVVSGSPLAAEALKRSWGFGDGSFGAGHRATVD